MINRQNILPEPDYSIPSTAIAALFGEPLHNGAAAKSLSAAIAALNAHSLAAVTDVDGKFLYVNERLCQLTGYRAAELIGRTIRVLDSGLNRPGVAEEIRRAVVGGVAWQGEICYRAKDDAQLWVDATVVPLQDESGGTRELFHVLYDITPRKNTEHLLLQSEARLKHLLAMSSDWYWEQDNHYQYTLISEGILQTGYEPEAFYGQARWDLAVDPDEEPWVKHREDLQAHRPYRDFEYRLPDPRAPGDWRWFSTSGDPVFAPDGTFTGYRGVGRDITARRKQQARLWELAHMDPLTSLPNRAKFTNELEQALINSSTSGDSFALAILDIDNFKSVNDSYGHSVGDHLLAVIAARLRHALRVSDYVGRLGGDEFAVILPVVDQDGGHWTILDTILNVTEEPIEINGEQHRRSVSIGVAVFPDDGTDGSDLIKYADLALYRAKSGGRSQIVRFEPALKEEVDRQSRLLIDVEEALHNDQLTLHYQPVVDVATGKLRCVEALLRWMHPTAGPIAAGTFHEVFDNTALAARIGRVVTDLALEQAAKWRAEGVEFGRMAINVTSGDFVFGDFPRRLADRLAHHGLHPRDVCVEVTEGMFLGEASEPVVNGLRILHRMGAEIAFDDFGTGHASLTHLRLPIDRLKIDRSFVKDIESDPTSAAIVRAIVGLGQSMSKQITVEGVETIQQAKTLQHLGCQQFQGYLFSRPIPPNEVADFVRSLQIPSELAPA